MFELYVSKYSIIAPVTWRGRCDVLAESRYASPLSKIGKSFLTAATSYIDVHLAVLDLHGVDLGRHHRGHPGHRAGLEVEARAMLRALDLEVEELAAAEEEILVCAHVVDGVEAAVLGVGEADLGVVGEHALERPDRDLVDRGDADPSQAAPPAPSRPSGAPARTGCARAPVRKSPARSSASRSTRVCRASAGRTGGSGRQGRPWRRACTARRCCRSRASGSRSPWRGRKAPGCGWPGTRPSARRPSRSGSSPRRRCVPRPAARP